MKICPKCGSAVEKNFCPECGFNLSQTVDNKEEFEEVREKVESVNKSETNVEVVKNDDEFNDGDINSVKTTQIEIKSNLKNPILKVGGIVAGIIILAMFMPCFHDWQDATCTIPKHCSKCDKVEGEALGHIKGDWEKTKEATLSNVGVEERLCSTCGESLDSRGTERKKAKVIDGKFNFTDEEFIEWINSWNNNFEVAENKIESNSLGVKDTCYNVKLTSTGSDGILILNHEENSNDNVSAIMTYFDNDLEATAFISLIAKNIEGQFSVDSAGQNLIDYDMAYVIGDINVMRINLSSNTEVALLAPLEYMGTILSGTALSKNDCLISLEKNNEEYLDYNNNVLRYMIDIYGEESACWFYDDDEESDGDDGELEDPDDIGTMKTYRGICLGESTENDVVNAYGDGTHLIFDKSSDVLYLTMKDAEMESIKYLEDTQKVLVYNYKNIYQIAMYIDHEGIVDLIAYFSGEWY